MQNKYLAYKSFLIFFNFILFIFSDCISVDRVQKSNPSPKPNFSLAEKEKYEDPIFNTYGEIKDSTICQSDIDSYVKKNKNEFKEDVTIYLIDQSGSMDLPFGKSSRMEYAKEKLKRAVLNLKEDPKTGKIQNFGIFSFGASFCNCIDVIQSPLVEFNKEELLKRISQIEATGGTPLFNSIQIISKYLEPMNGKFHLIILTDGLDNCGGNESAVKELVSIQNANLIIETEVIGIDLNNEGISFYQSLSKEMNGKFRNEEFSNLPVSLEDYLMEINNYPKNCKHSSMPSKIIASCSEQYNTFNLENLDDKDLYHFELMNSGNITDRRKTYSYFQENCKSKAPFREALEKKARMDQLPEWERNEIQTVLDFCKLENGNKLIDYNQTGFYFNPQYSNGTGDLILRFTNQSNLSTKVEYEIQSESKNIYTSSSTNKYLFVVPPDATLDKRLSLTIVENQNVGLKILEKTSEGIKQYKMDGIIDARGKGFAPKTLPVGKIYPVYFYSESDQLDLKATVFPRGQLKPINSEKMRMIKKQDDLYLYKSEIDLLGYSGEIDVQIEKHE